MAYDNLRIELLAPRQPHTDLAIFSMWVDVFDADGDSFTVSANSGTGEVCFHCDGWAELDRQMLHELEDVIVLYEALRRTRGMRFKKDVRALLRSHSYTARTITIERD